MEVLVILAILLPSAVVLGYFIECSYQGRWIHPKEFWRTKGIIETDSGANHDQQESSPPLQ